jgi:two-component system OmpR family response regulator
MGEETDRIIGLEMGADDYLPKGANPRELPARIRAVLRRAELRRAVPVALDIKYWSLRAGG